MHRYINSAMRLSLFVHAAPDCELGRREFGGLLSTFGQIQAAFAGGNVAPCHQNVVEPISQQTIGEPTMLAINDHDDLSLQKVQNIRTALFSRSRSSPPKPQLRMFPVNGCSPYGPSPRSARTSSSSSG